MRIEIIEIAKFKLDGGAMFGVVPKRIWNKLHPADENNMCTWAMRCLYVEDGDRKIIIDTGIGNKQDEKFRSFFLPHDELTFEKALSYFHISTEDITDVIVTHFHFDHVGGAISIGQSGKPEPTFPNATYWTNEIHYNWAYNANPRESASFLKENFVPLKDMGRLKYIDVQDGIQLSPNISLTFVNGHTEAMMIPHISLPNGNKIIYCADLIPSRHHIPMPYIIAYDMKPLETLKEKQALFDIALQPNHYLFFEHDADTACGNIVKNENGRVVFDKKVELAQILK